MSIPAELVQLQRGHNSLQKAVAYAAIVIGAALLAIYPFFPLDWVPVLSLFVATPGVFALLTHSRKAASEMDSLLQSEKRDVQLEIFEFFKDFEFRAEQYIFVVKDDRTDAQKSHWKFSTSWPLSEKESEVRFARGRVWFARSGGEPLAIEYESRFALLKGMLKNYP